jgi:hypothetical protein
MSSGMTSRTALNLGKRLGIFLQDARLSFWIS